MFLTWRLIHKPLLLFSNTTRKALAKWQQAVKLGKGSNFFKKITHSSMSSDIGNIEKEITTEKVENDETNEEKPSTWSEHVWSTFIHRGYSDDVTEKQPLLNGKVNLLPSIGEQNLITRFILGFADELPTR